MRKKKRDKFKVEVEFVYPDFLIKIYKGRNEVGSGFFASLAEGIIWSYRVISEQMELPFSFDGCPEHYPKEMRENKQRK